MTEADTPAVLATRSGSVATLTLNRGAQLNLLSEAMLDALQRALDELATADDTLRCVVLAASGRAFCAGHDLRELRAIEGEDGARALFARCSRVMLSLRALPVPVIAQVHGAAVAAGCQLVAACDLAVAARSARFAVSGIDLGLFCSTPAVALSRAVPIKPAFEMLVTGRAIGADEARTLGLVNAVAADEDLPAAVQAMAAAICAKSPDAVRRGKRMVYAQAGMALPDAYRFAGEVMADNLATADAQAGIGAFLSRP